MAVSTARIASAPTVPAEGAALQLPEGVLALLAPDASALRHALAEAGPRALVLTCACRDFDGESRSGSASWAAMAAASTVRRRPSSPTSARSIVFIIPRSWMSLALAGRPAGSADDAWTGAYYLPDRVNALMVTALEADQAGFTSALYRAAKCQELLCEVVDLWRTGDLTPRNAAANLTLADAERLMEARRIIGARFADKLTLADIARACGLNRAKLTEGFRQLFGQSVVEALAEHRLQWAARELRTSSRAVASVGYAAGYLNNASFARAFARRFGQPPTEFRRAPSQRPVLAVAPS